MNKIISIIFIFLFTGCSTLPGNSLSTGNIFMSDEPITEIIPITAEILLDLNQDSNLSFSNESFNVNNIHDGYYYKVGIGDVLNIIVWDHPELTIPAGQFRSAGESGNVVHQNGTIFYPYVGYIEVLGLNVTEIRDLLSKRLAQYIENPQVDVSVAAYNSQKVFVSGSVKSPTSLPITNSPLTLLDAILSSGGLADDANMRSITLTRTIGNNISTERIDLHALMYEGETGQNRLLMPGDAIHVPRNDELKVFIMGDVINPQTLKIQRNGLSLAEAISNSGGIDSLKANFKGIFILRSDKNGQVLIYQLKADITSRLVLSTKFQLKPMDIVYVTSAPRARWNMLVNQLLPSVNTIYQLDRLYDEDK